MGIELIFFCEPVARRAERYAEIYMIYDANYASLDINISANAHRRLSGDMTRRAPRA